MLIAIAAACAENDEVDGKAAQVRFDEAETLRTAYEKAATSKAIEKYVEARDLWRGIGDYESAALAAKSLGTAHEQLGNLARAVESYGEAFDLARQSGDRLLEAQLQGTLGTAQAFLGSDETAWRRAEANCQVALALAEEIGSDSERARAWNCFAEVDYARARPGEALSQHERAESVLRKIGDRASLVQTLLGSGACHNDLDSFEAAEAKFTEALAISKSIGDQRGTALALVSIAHMQRKRSKFQLALNQFYAAGEMFERMGDTVTLALSHVGIASVYMKMGQYQNAVEFWNLVLRSYEEAGFYNYVPDILEDLGLTKLALGDPDGALADFNRALMLSKQSGNTFGYALALRDLGYAHYAIDRPKAALEYLLQLLELDETFQNPRVKAHALCDIGLVYSALGESQMATAYLKRALRRYEEATDRTGQARALFGLAKTHDALGNLELARHHLETALEVIESLRVDVVRHDMRASYVASVHEYYRLHVDLLMRTHRELPEDGLHRAAFQASERARARSLLENLAATGVNLREGADARLIAEEARIHEQLDEHYRRRAAAGEETGEVADRRADEARELEAQHEQIRARILASSPKYAALTSPRPLTAGEAQSEILDDDTALLEYSLGEERSYLFVVTSDDFATYTLPGRSEIDDLARRVHSLAARPPASRVDEARFWSTAARLSELILGPAMARIGGRRLVVVSDGALRYLPFGALPKPGRREARPVPLIADHEIVALPSASALAVLRAETRDRPRPSRALAVFADPVFSDVDPRLAAGMPTATVALNHDARTDPALPSSGDLAGGANHRGASGREIASIGSLRGGGLNLGRLPHTAREAERIEEVVPDGDFLERVGFGASRDAALDPALRNYRIIHFATHARFDETEPGLSGLIFSRFDRRGRARDGFVRLHDIYDLRLPAELVVLSACDTALGKHIEGEGLVGIVRGFMYAGSKRVVASFWQVADAATAELMNRFYLEMFGNQLAPPAALRKAQLHVMSQPRWRHPFYWAAFSFQGEWRSD